MKENLIDWEAYNRIRDKYSHVSSFAYWPKDHSGNCAAPLLAESEEEFKQKLEGKIHANVVIVGMNFGVNDEISQLMSYDSNTIEDLIVSWKKINNMSNQYGGHYGKKGLNKAFKGTLVQGAYMTDLIKFNTVEKNWEATGVPSKEQDGIDSIIESTPNFLEFNIQGLKSELYDVVGINKDPIFIFLGDKYFNDPKVKRLVNHYFPNSDLYEFSHYARYGYTTNEFIAEGKILVEEIVNTTN